MTADLHILHVFSTFKIGGAQVRFAELAKGFGNRFSHTVIAMDGSYAAALTKHGLLDNSAAAQLAAAK